MPNLSYFSHAVLLKWMRGMATPPVTQLYLGVMTAAPNPDGSNVIEPAGSYSRMPVSFTQQTTSGGISVTQNTADIVFPVATVDWPQVSYIGVFDQDRNLLVYGGMAQIRSIKAGDSLGIAAGSVQIKLR